MLNEALGCGKQVEHNDVADMSWPAINSTPNGSCKPAEYRYERTYYDCPCFQWEQIFKDPMTTAAAIDRLVHHSVIIELNIPSYRLETAKNTRKPSAEAAPAQPAN